VNSDGEEKNGIYILCIFFSILSRHIYAIVEAEKSQKTVLFCVCYVIINLKVGILCTEWCSGYSAQFLCYTLFNGYKMYFNIKHF